MKKKCYYIPELEIKCISKDVLLFSLDGDNLDGWDENWDVKDKGGNL